MNHATHLPAGSWGGERALVSLGLGISAVFVFFVAAEAFEVRGTNSIREIVASSLFGAGYIAFCQFWCTPRANRSLSADLTAGAALNAPLLAVAILVFLGESRSLVPGIPWLAAGALGSLGGGVAAVQLHRLSSVEKPANDASDQIRSSHRILLAAFVLLVIVAPIILLGVELPLLADHTPGFFAGRVAIFLGGTTLFNLLAAYLVWEVLRSVRRDRFSRGTLGPPVFLALLLGFIFAFASGIRSQNPALWTASVLLVVCAAADLSAMVLVAIASLRADREERPPVPGA